MKFKNYILPILAVVLVVIYIIIQMSEKEYNVNKLLPENLNIKKIVYHNNDLSFVVENDNKTGNWMLTKPEKWPANNDEIRDLLEALKHIDVITELGNIEDNNSYEITNNNYLQLENGGINKIYIGKRDSTYKMVYVRLNNEKKTKLVDASFTNYLPTSLNQIKDKKVYSFDGKKLSHYKIKVDNKTFELSLNNGKYVIDNKSLDDNVSVEFIKNISTLTANTFVSKEQMDNATKTGFIEFTVDNVTKEIKIYKDKDGDFLLPANDKSLFKIYNFTMDNFLKKFEKL